MSERICSVDDCGRPVQARGMCRLHYDRWRRNRTDTPRCEAPDCDTPRHIHSLCSRHYQQWRKTGLPALREITPLERFCEKVDFSGDCWLWTGYKDPWGYGKYNGGGGTTVAHRWLWEQVVGSVGAGLQLDHLCGVPACVNPDHLEPVTPSQNYRRSGNASSVNRAKTHCVNGHEFTPENTYRRPEGGRACQTCRRERRRSP